MIPRILFATLITCSIAIAETCPSCGADAGQGANFCPKCGAALEGADKATEMALKEAEDRQREFLESLEKLKDAYEESGQGGRALEIAQLIRVVEMSKLDGSGAPVGQPAGKGGGKSIKEANDLFEKAKVYMSTRNPARRGANLNSAAGWLREIIEDYPDSDKVVDAHYNLGHIYSDLRRYDEAVKEFDTVVELDPEYSGDGRFLAARIQDNLGKWKDAYDRYSDVIEHDANTRNVEWSKARKVQLEPYIK